MDHQGFQVEAAGSQNVLVSSEEGVLHHNDNITQEAFGSLAVELQEEIPSMTWNFHGTQHRLQSATCNNRYLRSGVRSDQTCRRRLHAHSDTQWASLAVASPLGLITENMQCLLGISMALTWRGQEPPMMPACMATPVTTARSGSTDVFGSFPKYSPISLRIRGIRVDPPTRTISSTSALSRRPSASTVSTGARIFWNRSSLSSSNSWRVITAWKRTGAAAAAAPPADSERSRAPRLKGTRTVALGWRTAVGPYHRLSLITLNTSPAMARVKNMPPCLLSRETSRVPPPRSTTSTLNTSTLCRP
ncbi:hypothetical protein EYF80_029573 [Liparis tanakae]|uniref:Uncharacterized protein n=1 Tax=Liparis tanakae TaxID=230148 RepID=A0A4Z2H2Z7_9TELE|nr:hypothetical protein EYF80_029573 [Liparis tanakae]